MKTSTITKNNKKISLWAVVFWLLIWQIGSIIISQEILLVSPISTFRRLSELVLEIDFWKSILFSFSKITTGFLLALMFGSIFAIFSSYVKKFNQLIEPLILVIQAVPVASFIILSLIWIPTRSLSIFISFLMVLPIVYRNILDGIHNIPKEIKEMADLFRISKAKRIRYIYLSQVAPYLRSACSVSLGLCWKSGIAAEVIGLPKNSIGENLYQAKIFLDTPDLFAWTVVIIVISILFQKIFLKIIDSILLKMENI